MSTQTTEQIGWAVLELMGHRKLAGRVEEATLAGGSFLRIDVYLPAGANHNGEHIEDEDGAPLLRIATQYYSPASVYAITPTTREMCLGVALRNQPSPVARWELPAPARDEAGPEPDEAQLAYDEWGDER